MWIKTRHKIVFKILRYPFKLFFKIKYNFKSINYKLENKPYLIVSNHYTILDPFMVASSFNKPVYFIASSDIYQNKFGKLIKWLVNPIFKNKNVKEMGPIKDAIRISKEGGIVGVFPEGNRTYSGKLCYFDDAIAKMAKMMKCDLILYNIEGGYGIDPRWCFKGRKGKSFGFVKKIITKEEIEKLSIEELFNTIKDNLTIEIVPTKEKYKSTKKAEGLERILYRCPLCESLQTITTKKDYIYCNKCELKVKYNENLEFESDNVKFKFKYVYEWYEDQINYIKRYDINMNNEIFKDNVNLFKIMNGKKELIFKGKLIMDNNEFKFKEEKNILCFNFDNVSAVTVLGKNKLNFYCSDCVYQIKADKTFNPIKYMYMYYHIKNVKEKREDEYFGI